MKSTLLITGGSGLLALNWALAAREDYAVVLGLHAREIRLSGVAIRYLDLETSDGALRAFEDARAQIVIHTAGMTNVEACERDPQLAHHINVEVASNVATACARAGIALAHISTDHLFSGESEWVDENEPPAPRNVYARTKAEAERRVLDANPSALVVRTNFYCWGPSYRPSFSDVILNALRSGRELTLFQDVCYTPILAEALAHAVQDLLAMRAHGIFNVVGDTRISKYEFGVRLADAFELDQGVLRPGYIGDQTALVPRPRNMSLSNRKARSLLGRPLGGPDRQIRRLQQQESLGLVREVQHL